MSQAAGFSGIATAGRRSTCVNAGGGMSSSSYTVETESGESYEGISEDLLFDLIGELSYPDNSFLTIESQGSGDQWYVVVTLDSDDRLEVEYRNPERREHRVVPGGTASRVASDVTIWVSSVVRR
ncbi:hypothetical protein [Streptomyces rochei]|uniref:hypothetical protein n=2 Tax=Streptomyces rochei TaxID=1928 RepID=UPI000FABCC95|nr:hypothetical protein EF915_34805 [Streptomyces sp. WAC08401]